MTNIRCRAANPETCRYHRPGAGQHAQVMLKQAEHKFRNAATLQDKEDAEAQMFLARSIYDATDEGYQQLRTLMRSDRSYENTLRYQYAKIARAEELQEGPAGTDVISLNHDTMKARVKSLQKIVSDGYSDHFLNIWDSYEQELKSSLQEENSYMFTAAYNSLVEDLEEEGSELEWFDERKKTAWLKDVRSCAIRGKVLRTHTTLDNLHASLTFEA